MILSPAMMSTGRVVFCLQCQQKWFNQFPKCVILARSDQQRRTLWSSAWTTRYPLLS